MLLILEEITRISGFPCGWWGLYPQKYTFKGLRILLKNHTTLFRQTGCVEHPAAQEKYNLTGHQVHQGNY